MHVSYLDYFFLFNSKNDYNMERREKKRWLVDCTTTDMRLPNSNHQNTIISGKPFRLKLHAKTSAERNCRSANSTNGQGTRVCTARKEKFNT